MNCPAAFLFQRVWCIVMQERILSIFIDESGDFGPYEQHSPYYQVEFIVVKDS